MNGSVLLHVQIVSSFAGIASTEDEHDMSNWRLASTQRWKCRVEQSPAWFAPQGRRQHVPKGTR